MTDLRQAAQQAVEALERYQVKRQDFDRFADDITALRTALEQQAEPVLLECVTCGTVYADGVPPQVPVQQQAEPVAWMYQHEETGRTAFIEMSEHKDGWKPSSSRMKLIGPLYTAAPPQRPWQGLTDEEMSDTVADIDVDFGDLLWKVVCLTKIIEAKLKERNT